MAVTTRSTEAISVALCRHLGVDDKRVFSVRFEHDVTDVPRVTFGMYAIDAEGKFFIDEDGNAAREDQTYEWRPVETAT